MLKYLLKRDFIADNIDLDNCEEIEEEKQTVPDKEATVTILECPFCDKTSYSSPGLKCNITKMNKNKTVFDVNKKEKVSIKNDEKEEVSIENDEKLLDASMVTLDEGESVTINLEENEYEMGVVNSPEKSYTHNCKSFDFKSEALHCRT
jgi:hypothetical protein